MDEEERDIKARALFEKAEAESDMLGTIAVAARWLGKFYMAGRGGLEVDMVKAQSLFKKAAEEGEATTGPRRGMLRFVVVV